ncbi:hypothetical protein RIF29_11929 [Crotalaria pallida]|uniref:Reverse transcriptase zinc-binding domain-containing protein n=1 Tax=Crotalaria pallida TaxID=3830 RepID=A0AAN9P1N7_CROPI
MTHDASCNLCKYQEETILHAMRDCPYAWLVWRKFLSPSHWDKFCIDNIEDWMVECLTTIMGTQTLQHWRVTFGTVLEALWRQRNKKIFEDEPINTEGCYRQIKYMVVDTISSLKSDIKNLTAVAFFLSTLAIVPIDEPQSGAESISLFQSVKFLQQLWKLELNSPLI